MNNKELEEKKEKWHTLFDNVSELIGEGKIVFNKTITCYYKYDKCAYEIVTIKEVEVIKGSLSTVMVLKLTNRVGCNSYVTISRIYENKSFGNILNETTVLIKIHNYLNKYKEKEEVYCFATEAL